MKQRIITAFLALIIFLPLLIYGHWPFIVLTYIMASIGLFELLRMREIPTTSFPSIIGFIFLWLTMLPNDYILVYSKSELIMLFVIIMLMYTVLSKNKFTFDDAGFLLIAVIYITMGFFYFMETRLDGLTYMFYVLLVVWSTDTGAYFIGRSFGKNKLWPEISPNKTIEGAIGGVVFACAVSFIFQFFYPFPYPSITMIAITIFISIFGQIGDLVASAYKRHFTVKDSGKLLPGHGGILDRMDSLLFAFPIFHFILLML